MSVVAAGETMCLMAIVEAAGAACVIPGVWPMVVEIGLAYSNPGAMEAAAGDWKEVSRQLDTLKKEMNQLAQGVPPEKWSAKDRDAFDAAVTNYQIELTKVSEFHAGAGDTLQTTAYVFFAFAVLAFTIAQIMVAWAVAIVTAAGSIVGAPAVPALEGTANTVAVTCEGIIATCMISMRTLIFVAAGIFGAGTLLQGQATQQALTPGESGPVTFQQATLGPLGMPDIRMPGTAPS